MVTTGTRIKSIPAKTRTDIEENNEDVMFYSDLLFRTKDLLIVFQYFSAA